MTLTVTLTPHLSDTDFSLYCGDALEVLRQLPDQHVHCIVCSPPYWGLRDYGVEGQVGLEATPQKYVAKLVEIFAEARRVLRNDGTLWLNLGDSYASNWGSGRKASWISSNSGDEEGRGWGVETALPPNMWRGTTIKPKDLVGIPWSVALALRDDCWYLRRDIIWSKPNPMPESCRDRCTTAHEYIFMFAKKSSYYYDADSIREPAEWARWGDQTNGKYKGQGTTGWIGSSSKEELQRRATVKTKKPDGWDTGAGGHGTIHRDGREKGAENQVEERGRNKRSVWDVSTQSYPEAHFATFPEELIEPMIKAGCPEGGTVLDPFMGSGTTALVARKLGRKSIGIELSSEYCDLAAKRLAQLSLLT